MQYQDYVSSLNEKQLSAVTSNEQYLRIVAGAGSGKTRVLTYRISYLISEMNVRPWKILAITFTNKVANEMKERVVSLVGDVNKDLTIKTFHSFAAMFLRREISVLGYPLNFTILDEEDQVKVIKDIASEMGYKKNDPIVKQALNYIGINKLDEKYPDDITIKIPRFDNEKVCLEIYERYEDVIRRQYALDFDDLLIKTNLIMDNYPLVKQKWRDRFDFVLIDEFQDTNKIEYKLIKNILKPSSSLTVVGDPDQNIYTWRGAKQDIIVDLHKEFPTLKTFVLEQNYRSTQTILDSGNKLISNNKLRVPKNLFTKNGKGNDVEVRCCGSGALEASFVAREINMLVNSKKYKYSDIAILYRSNYITLEFEKEFMAKSIPYVIYGGTKFYQRMEIKDVIAYFRLINNFKDDISFERIINVPKRGIGEKSIDLIKKSALTANLSIYEYLSTPEAKDSLPPKIYIALSSLIMAIEVVKTKLKDDTEIFSKTLEDFINDIGYYNYLNELDDGEDRLANVKSLFDDIRHYLKSNPDSTFDEYLQNVSLVSSQDDITEGQHVKMMTVHTAKGLEFPVVFIVRLNQGVFPNNKSLLESGYTAMEEERRLCYVAITRAKEKLYLSFAEGYSYVSQEYLSESQFIKESGNQVSKIQETTFSKTFSNDYGFTKQVRPTSYKINDEVQHQDFSQVVNDVTSWQVGDVVIHKNLGKGIVIKVEDEMIIQVDFESCGIKTILGNHPAVSKGSK
ncbi:MAG: UvrD-helicase domain-containing protein [Bacilli bacterium]|nr:UvrD-helicase domain-containing protein [Bacilli bacterium]